MLENVRIVLVNTSDCRNIGSAARAMKTMGLSQLVLVDPLEMPNGQAQALAAGATDVLANATQLGADTVIGFSGGHQVTLIGVNLADLHEDDLLI